MTENNLSALEEHCIESIQNIPTVSTFAQAKRLVRKYILGQLVEPLDYIPWPKGCLLAGLVRAGHRDAVAAYFDQWMKKGGEVYTVDDLLAGQALLELLDLCEEDHKERGNESPYNLVRLRFMEDGLHKMMALLYRHDRDLKGSFPYRPLHKNDHIYADGIGMICPFAIGYGIRYEDDAAVTMGLNQLRNFFELGMDKETALPYHAYRYLSKEKTLTFGDLGWGRAVGWIMYGLAISIKYLKTRPERYQKELSELKQMAGSLAEAVIPYQREDGLFPAHFKNEESKTDTSATAMILHLLVALNNSSYEPAIAKGLAGLDNNCSEGKVFGAQSECIALGKYGQTYDSYPWSEGMTLSLLSVK